MVFGSLVDPNVSELTNWRANVDSRLPSLIAVYEQHLVDTPDSGDTVQSRLTPIWCPCEVIRSSWKENRRLVKPSAAGNGIEVVA